MMFKFLQMNLNTDNFLGWRPLLVAKVFRKVMFSWPSLLVWKNKYPKKLYLQVMAEPGEKKKIINKSTVGHEVYKFKTHACSTTTRCPGTITVVYP